jgi:hypothetical protein
MNHENNGTDHMAMHKGAALKKLGRNSRSSKKRLARSMKT